MRPNNPIHPGQMLLKEFIEPSNISRNKISRREFAKHLGWTTTKLNELIRGKRGITAATALDLSKSLKTSPELWLQLQMYVDLHEEEMNRKRAS